MSTQPKDPAVAYCRYRLSGMTCMEAADNAGYSSGPSPKAKRLYARVKAVSVEEHPNAKDMKAVLQKQEERLARLVADVQKMRDWVCAIEVYSLGPHKGPNS